MRVRVVVAIALVLVAGALVLDMSGRAHRTAGTDHINPNAFVAKLDGGQELCQAQMALPGNVQSFKILIGSFGHPLPALRARFLDEDGAQVASGTVPAGAHEGLVSIPLRPARSSATGGTLCVAAGGHGGPVVIGGEPFAPGVNSETVAGKRQGGRVAVVFERSGRESWWQLLPTLSERFGFGKASFFGDWTLAVVALLLLGVWVATVRLLLRELRT